MLVILPFSFFFFFFFFFVKQELMCNICDKKFRLYGNKLESYSNKFSLFLIYILLLDCGFLNVRVNLFLTSSYEGV